MIISYKKSGHVCIILAIILSFFIWRPSESEELIALKPLFLMAGMILFIAGVYSYAKGKGYSTIASALLGTLGSLNIIGLIVVALLPDKGIKEDSSKYLDIKTQQKAKKHYLNVLIVGFIAIILGFLAGLNSTENFMILRGFFNLIGITFVIYGLFTFFTKQNLKEDSPNNEKYCAKCGIIAIANVNFCSGCGNKLK